MNASRLALIAAALCALAGPAAAQNAQSTWDRILSTKTLRVGFPVGEPLAFKDITGSSAPGGVKFGDDTWRGIGPVLGKMIADALGVKIELVEGTDAGSIAGLQANLIDAFLPVEGTPERAKGADFVSANIMWSAMTYYSRTADAPNTWDALDDSKYKIGVVLGAHTDFFAKEHLPKATISRFPDPAAQIAALQSGRVDGIVLVGTVASAAYGKLKIGKLVTPTPIDETTNTVAIRQEPDQRWHNYLTTAINWYYTSGTIEKIFDDFLAYRGIDPKDVLPVMREHWPK
ncbi:MAG TPA: transporter substrate-binding domain-containing protein [Beijerinckiaceae bacterium]|nr:transporter substrate-binding domain-containing protein [Beijerinckiaceae bacterium]